MRAKTGIKWAATFSIGILLISFTNCTKDHTAPLDPASASGYPANIAKIISANCTNAGCHNVQSKVAAGGLAMDTWAHLFEGGSGGSVVIPYRPDQSWVLFFTNTDTARGPALQPTMPFNKPPLSNDDYNTLLNWIAAGAPDVNGNVAFSGDPNRHKFYVTDQGCDEVTVFDRATLLAMRYIHVGVTPQIETPHQIRMSPDGQYWYVVFVNGSVLQKFRTSDDSLVGNINLGFALWSTIAITPDGKYGYVADWEANGRIAYVDLENLKVIQYYQGDNLFSYPHGAWLNHAANTLYVTAQYGNFIYKLDVTNPSNPVINQIGLAPGQALTTTPGSLDPHEVILSPDESKYFVTCMSSNEVRVMNTANDSLMDVIKVGVYPLEMAYSKKYPYLFVSCEEDPSFDGNTKVRGSIYVINYETLQVVKVLQGDMFQPHGVFVDDDGGYVYVTNRNVDPTGPAPHHVSNCGGRNGFMKIITLNADPNALEFIPGYRTEVSVDPYSVTGR